MMLTNGELAATIIGCIVGAPTIVTAFMMIVLGWDETKKKLGAWFSYRSSSTDVEMAPVTPPPAPMPDPATFGAAVAAAFNPAAIGAAVAAALDPTALGAGISKTVAKTLGPILEWFAPLAPDERAKQTILYANIEDTLQELGEVAGAASVRQRNVSGRQDGNEVEASSNFL